MRIRHLQTQAQFQALLKRPPIAKTPHFALHRCLLSTGSTGAAQDAVLWGRCVDTVWLGAMTPKRWARRAVTRNTIRRQIYAVVAVQDAPLAAGAYLVRLRAAFARSQFPSATSDALRRATRQELQHLLLQAHTRSHNELVNPSRQGAT